MSRRAPHAGALSYFVTGTDTGVGKTLVGCALLRAFAAQGERVAGMKPIAAGAEGGRWEDVEALLGETTAEVAREWVNPYAFEPPVAPHLAAEREGVRIEIPVIVTAFERLRGAAGRVVVEGVGGFRVPLNDREDGADLARALGLPVILVVGMRLGCLNHALLTAQAVREAGLPLAGWVANHVDAAMLEPEGNLRTLEDRLHSPLLARIPFLDRADAAAAAPFLRLEALAVR